MITAKEARALFIEDVSPSINLREIWRQIRKVSNRQLFINIESEKLNETDIFILKNQGYKILELKNLNLIQINWDD